MSEVNFHQPQGSGSAYSLDIAPIQEVALKYPLSWKVDCHPLAKVVERKVLAWLKDIGVVRDAEAEERFEKLTVWAYVGWPFPRSSPEVLEVLMRFLALWIFYDDIIEEKDDGVQSLIQKAVAGDLDQFPGGSPHFRGWWELGQTYNKVMSPAWCRRHGERFAEWLQGVREEGEMVKVFRERGKAPYAAQCLRVRTISIGQVPNLDFVEYQNGWELPESLLQDPDMQTITNLSAEVVGLINDIYGFSKDQKGRWSNVVFSLAEEFHIPLDEAFRWAVALQNARVRQISELEPGLLARSSDPRHLAEWFDGLHYIMYGFARWHEIAARYSNTYEVGGGRQIRIAVREEAETIHS